MGLNPVSALEDKQTMARKIYHMAPLRDRDGTKKELAESLSVSERTIRGWLSRIDKDEKEAQDKRILDLWMACRTLDDISEIEDVPKQTLSGRISDLSDFGKIAKSVQSAADHHSQLRSSKPATRLA